MKSDAFFRMPTICANVEMNSSVLWNEIWSSFCAQKRYRALQKLYGKVSDPIHVLEKKEVLSDEETQKLNHLKKERAELTNSMNKMRESYQVTWDFCRTKMMELKETYHLQSIFALSRAEDIWAAIETILYLSGRKLHFKKRGDLPKKKKRQHTKTLLWKRKYWM